MIKPKIGKSYKIIWQDAFHRLGWISVEDIQDDALITTYGILVKETKSHYVLSGSKTGNYGWLNGIMGIPKKVIITIKEIK